METTPSDVVYTVAEAALLLKKSKSWLYRAAQKGAITVARVGSTLRIGRSEIKRLLQPVNTERVQEWTRAELLQWEIKRDAATMKAISARYRQPPG